MKKVLLDFSIPDTKIKTQEYIAEKMGFPDYYGKNLDALYDELTSISEPTAVGIFLPIADMIDLDIDLMVYFDTISEVFSDAEEANPQLAVIYGDLIMNPEYEDAFGDDFDDYLEDLQDGEDPDADPEWESDGEYDEELDGDPGQMDVPGDKDVIFLDIRNRNK